jgi:hypothetical protein
MKSQSSKRRARRPSWKLNNNKKLRKRSKLKLPQRKTKMNLQVSLASMPLKLDRSTKKKEMLK